MAAFEVPTVFDIDALTIVEMSACHRSPCIYHGWTMMMCGHLSSFYRTDLGRRVRAERVWAALHPTHPIVVHIPSSALPDGWWFQDMGTNPILHAPPHPKFLRTVNPCFLICLNNTVIYDCLR